MTKLSNLTVKGQVTIPKDVRDALGLAAGDRVEFDWNDRGEAVIRKAAVDEEQQRAEIYRGFARAAEIMRPYRWNMPTDEIMKELRGDDPLLRVIYVDTNVILDVTEANGVWRDWSAKALMRGRRAGLIVTGPVVVGELAVRGAPKEAVLDSLSAMGIRATTMDADAGHRAGIALRDYRLAGGTREKMIADFLIGAHAAVLGAALLTRDAGPFRRYFPELDLITPEDDDG